MTGPDAVTRTLDDVLPDATHGSYCPKMCAYSCPVLAATGREETNPWGLHRSVVAVGSGHRGEAAYRSLHGCTGCHACQRACLYDLDVPGEVRAARAKVVADGGAPASVLRFAEDIGTGVSPYGTSASDSRSDAPDVRIVLGCADGPEIAAAVAHLFAAAGQRADVVVPEGCCGALLDDLGAQEPAAASRQWLRDRVGDGVPVATTDPHCLPSLRAAFPGSDVDHVTDVLAGLHGDGRIAFTPGPPVAYHDPCVLARDERQTSAPRLLLGAAAEAVVEPEAAGAGTACSGAGMGFDLLAPVDAADVARRRAAQLRATGTNVVSACARAERLLSSVGTPVVDLVVFLSERVDRPPRGDDT